MVGLWLPVHSPFPFQEHPYLPWELSTHSSPEVKVALALPWATRGPWCVSQWYLGLGRNSDPCPPSGFCDPAQMIRARVSVNKSSSLGQDGFPSFWMWVWLWPIPECSCDFKLQALSLLLFSSNNVFNYLCIWIITVSCCSYSFGMTFLKWDCWGKGHIYI